MLIGEAMMPLLKPLTAAAIMIATPPCFAQQSNERSSICHFIDGPRADENQDFAPMAPLPVGTPCQDGAGSSGSVVAALRPRGSRPSVRSGKSTICYFKMGPRAGQSQDYAPLPPIAIGSFCQDGQGSEGVAGE